MRKLEKQESDGEIVETLVVPTLTVPGTSKSQESVKGSKSSLATNRSATRTDKKNKSSKKKSKTDSKKFSEVGDDQALRSPSRLGYSEDIPVIIEEAWENTSQDSNRDFQKGDNFKFLDLKDINEESDRPQNSLRLTRDPETRDNAQQTDFPVSPSSPNTAGAVEEKNVHNKHFVTSHSYISKEQQKGTSPKHPYEKTVFFVKSPAGSPPTDHGVYSRQSQYSHSIASPISSSRVKEQQSYSQSFSPQLDSGYGSRQETIRIRAQSASSDKTSSSKETPRVINNCTFLSNLVDYKPQQEQGRQLVPDSPRKSTTANMSCPTYGTEIYSPPSSSRIQDKEDLQILNERFSNYIQKVRMLSQQTNRLDTGSFIKQTRILEEEVANLKTLYERELDVIRQELSATSRERNNHQLQSEKNKQVAIEFENRLAAEADKNRRLMDELNQVQRRTTGLETELMNLRQAGDGRSDFQSLQREMDKIIRENEDHKHRQEQEALLRSEAEDKCHVLTKKLEFMEQVHEQQVAELRERVEQSQATIISLDARLRTATENDIAVPEVLKQVRDQAEKQLKQYQFESEEHYNRNIAALKCQMDNDAHTIERTSLEKSQLQGQIGELNAKLRNLEGQIMTLEHQRSTVEGLIQQERERSTCQIREMEKKLRDMQELVFIKMREENTTRDLNVPLKAEIEAMKVLLEEEEKRLRMRETVILQSPFTAASTSHVTQVSSTCTAQPSLPAVSQSQVFSMQAATQPYPPAPVSTQEAYPPLSPTQHFSMLETPFVTQSAAHTMYQDQSSLQEPVFTNVTMPTVSEQDNYIGSTRYTYETTPSINRLHIDSSPRNSPRIVGPIARAKSAPAGKRTSSNAPLVPTALGQGKDYFDEMFKDLTRETLYTQTRPNSSPVDRPPSGAKERPPSAARERPPSGRPSSAATKERPASALRERPPSRSEVVATEERELDFTHEATGFDMITDQQTAVATLERPPSSVYHDYATATSSAVGEVKILEVNQEGKFVRLINEGKQEIEFGGYMIQQNVGGHPVAVFRFPPRTKFADEGTITVWSGSTDTIEHQPPRDFVWREQQKWGTGPECTTILCKPNGQAIAWMTAAHRFSKNPYDDAGAADKSDEFLVYDTGVPVSTNNEPLTEMNVNLNEPRPDPVYLRREKQSPPSLNAQKHPHGTSTSKDTHPHMGQSRPLTYGNDNSSVNRQSRCQSTRPDPIPGQPYAGGSGNRIGSAPLRKYRSPTGNIRGSGAIANRSAGSIRHGPPTPFLSPKQQEYSEFCANRPLVRFST